MKHILSPKYVVRGFLSFLVIALMYTPIHTYALTAIAALPTPPNVSTVSETYLSTSATLSGHFSNTDSEKTYTEFQWGTNSNPSSLNNETGYIGQLSTSGNFSANITGLTPNTTYYFRAVAKNTQGGIKTADQVLSFTTNPPVTPDCYVNSFTSDASNNTVQMWGTATLHWTQQNCTSLTLSSSDNNFAETPVSGTSIVTETLGIPTTFVLKGTDAAGTLSQLSLTLNVSSATVTNSTCSIYSFTINDTSSTQIYNNAFATLKWNTASGCTNVSIVGSNGADFENLSNHSQTIVGPFNNTVTYTLRASDSTGATQQMQVTGSVNNPNNGGFIGYNNYGDCSISSFVSSLSTVSSGQSVMLSWSTDGSCSNVYISGTNNSIPYNYTLPTRGTIETNPLYGTSTFYITADGNTSATFAPLIVAVTGGPYAYSDQGSSNSILTSVASNVGSDSVRLNGVVVGSPYPSSAWFEYGTDPSVNLMTTQQSFPAGGTVSYYYTIYTNPSTTYYYRAVGKINGVTYRGSIMSVGTKDSSDNTTYVSNNTPAQTTAATPASTTVAPKAAEVTLAITNPSEKIYIGDTIDFKIVYSNDTNKKLSNAKLNITLPQGFTIIQTTRGQVASPSMINVNLGSLEAGATDSIFVQAKVENTVSLTTTLVTNGTLSYTNPNGSSDSSVGYVLNHAAGVASLGGFALGAGFFPTTILGWLVTILIILAVILTIRRISKAGKGGGGGHH